MDGRGKKAVHDKFVNSTFGSHHIRLVNHVTALFNALREKQPSQVRSDLHPMDSLLLVDSGETFGLVSSAHTASYGGLLEIKEEPTTEIDPFLQELDAHATEMDWQPVVQLNSTSNSDTSGEPNRDPLVTEPRLGDSKGKRKALEILGIETSSDHLNISTTVSPVEKRRRRDQPHVPTEPESSIAAWLHNGDDLPVRNHIQILL